MTRVITTYFVSDSARTCDLSLIVCCNVTFEPRGNYGKVPYSRARHVGHSGARTQGYETVPLSTAPHIEHRYFPGLVYTCTYSSTLISIQYSGMVTNLLDHGANVSDALLRAVDVGYDETSKAILKYVDTLAVSINIL